MHIDSEITDEKRFSSACFRRVVFPEIEMSRLSLAAKIRVI